MENITPKSKSFIGKEAFCTFFEEKYKITGKPGHRVLRTALYTEYQTYCKSNNVIPASLINIGMLLGELGVTKKVRVGGYKGKGQQYAYVGICLVGTPEDGPHAENTSTRSRHYKKRKPLPTTKVIKITNKTASVHKFIKKYYVLSTECKSFVCVDEFKHKYHTYCKRKKQTPVSAVSLMIYLQQIGVKTSLRMGKGSHLFYYGLAHRNLTSPSAAAPTGTGTHCCPLSVYTLPC